MGEILKDTSNRIVTLCKCGEENNSVNLRNCQMTCEYYESGRRGGWCCHYEAGAKMCRHQEIKQEVSI